MIGDKMNVVFEYLYRDLGNVKNYNLIVLGNKNNLAS
jgi:hypothetical protein